MLMSVIIYCNKCKRKSVGGIRIKIDLGEYPCSLCGSWDTKVIEEMIQQ